MQPRTRIAVIVVAVIAAVACVLPFGLSALRAANRPPVVITMPRGANNPPLPYASVSTGALTTGAAPDSKDQAAGNQPNTSAAADYSSVAAAAAPTAASAAMLYIHVAGAVRRPGVYQLADGSRVFNAVHAAGGALPNGDTEAVNLAEKLEDGEKVVVPLKGQNDDFETDSGDGTVVAADVNTADSLKSATHGGGRRAKAKRGKAKASSSAASETGSDAAPSGSRVSKITHGKININTAGVAQLERLPGVGPALAARIMVGRKALHGFQKITDLLYIRGLAQGKYKAIEPYVTL